MSPKSPASAGRTALQRSNYLLGQDHLHRIAAQLYRFLSEQAGQGDLGRLGPDRVADADMFGRNITLTGDPAPGPRRHRGADARRAERQRRARPGVRPHHQLPTSTASGYVCPDPMWL